MYSNVAVLGSLGATLISLSLFLYLSHSQMSESSELGNNGPGQVISSSRAIRLAIFLLSNILIAACAVFSVVNIYIYIRCAVVVKRKKMFSIYFLNMRFTSLM